MLPRLARMYVDVLSRFDRRDAESSTQRGELFPANTFLDRCAPGLRCTRRCVPLETQTIIKVKVTRSSRDPSFGNGHAAIARPKNNWPAPGENQARNRTRQPRIHACRAALPRGYPLGCECMYTKSEFNPLNAARTAFVRHKRHPAVDDITDSLCCPDSTHECETTSILIPSILFIAIFTPVC